MFATILWATDGSENSMRLPRLASCPVIVVLQKATERAHLALH